MRIAYITNEFPSLNKTDCGGLGTYTRNIAVALKKAGHDPVIFIPGPKNVTRSCDGLPLLEVALKNNLSQPVDFIMRGMCRILGFPTWRTRIAIHQGTKNIIHSILLYHKKFPIDVIQCPNLMGDFTSLSRIIPCVVRISGQTIKLLQHKALNNKDQIVINEYIQLEKRMLRKCPHIIAPSRQTADQITELYSKQVTVLVSPQPSTDTSLDETYYQQTLKGVKYLLYFGTLSQHKGVEVLADCIPEVLNSHPDISVVLAGRTFDTEDGRTLYNKLQSLEKMMNGRMFLLPPLNRERLFPIIKYSYGCILPSITDNLPNTCIEALSYGKIIIATTGNGFEQAVENGVNGYLVPPGCKAPLMDAINKLLTFSKEKIAAMTEASRNRSVIFSPEAVAENHIQYYSNLPRP